MGHGRFAKQGALANPGDWASPHPSPSNPARPAWKIPVRPPGPKSPDAPFRVPGRSPRDVFPGRIPVPFGKKPVGPLTSPQIPGKAPRLPFLPGLPPWVVPLLDPWWADPRLYGPENYSKTPFPGVFPNPTAGMMWSLRCIATPQLSPPIYPAITHVGYRSGNVNSGDCGLGLQAWTEAVLLPDAWPAASIGTPTQQTGVILERHISISRYRYHSVWWRTLLPGNYPAHVNFVPMPWSFVPTPDDMPNPNDTRGLPTSPLGDPHAPLRPGGNPKLAPPIAFLPSPDYQSGRNPWEDWMEGVVDEVVKLPDDPTDGGEPPSDDEDKKPWGNVGYPPNMTNPHTRIVTRIYPDGSMRTDYRIPRNMRPPPRTKERKRRVRFFNWLDWISEAGEVVDALYDGLPKKVRQKWEKEHQGGHWVYDKREKRWEWYLDPNRHPAIDQAGQYGISGADWKARALWHNWDKVDLDAALRNIIKNTFEDRFLGEIHKRLPRNVGAALDPAFLELWKSFDAGMDKVLDWIMFDETAGSILSELQP